MSGSIKGLVINRLDNQPIAQALCRYQGEGVDGELTAGNDGRYQTPDLAAGTYEMTISKDGFETGIYGPLVVIDGHPTEIFVALEPKDL